MKLDSGSDILIRRYLLANISESERERVETRLMTDDDFFQQINLVEDELIDQYLNGELSRPEHERFESFFLSSHERQEKLRFARALKAYAAAHAPIPAPRPEPWWQPIAALLNPLRPVPAYSLVMALLVLAGGAPLAVRQIAALKGRVVELQTQQANAASQIEEQKARTDQATARLQQELDRRSKENAGGATQIAMLNPPAFLLSPGMQRGGQSSRPFEIAKDQILVRIKLDLPQNPHVTYRAVLLSDGQKIFERSLLKAVETPDRITISLDLPIAGLPGGDYEIRLYGSGEQEPMETYPFQFFRK